MAKNKTTKREPLAVKYCRHECGWVLNEMVVEGQQNIIGEFTCNSLGCKAKRFMEFDISTARPLSKEQIDDLNKFGNYPKLDKKGFVK